MTAYERSLRVESDNFAPDLSKDFDLASFGRRLLRNWYWFVISLALAIGAAWLYLRYTVPTYEAQAKVLIKDEETGMGISPEALGEELGFETAYKVENEIQVFTSKQLMRQVVDSMNLNIVYSYEGRVKTTDLYQPEGFRAELADSIYYDERIPAEYGEIELQLRPNGDVYQVRGERDTVRMDPGKLLQIGNRYFVFRKLPEFTPPRRNYLFTVRWLDPQKVASSYTDRLSVEQLGKSNVVALALTDTDPARAEQVLNSLVAYYDRGIVDESARQGALTLDFIDERLEYVRAELFDVEGRMEVYKRDRSLSVGVEGTAVDYLTRLNASDEQLAELSVRREIIDEILRIISDPENEFESIPISSEIIDGPLASLIQNYNELIFLRSQKLESATELNPAVATFSEQLNSLRSTVARSLRSLSQETLERENRIRERIAPLEENLTSIPASERKLIELTREQKIKETLYVFLSQRWEETAITVAAKVGNTRIIEPAEVDPGASSPKPVPTYAFAFVLAFLMPATVLGLRELIDDRVQTVDEIKAATVTPVLGSIIRGRATKGLAVSASSRSATTEMFRLLRTNLQFLLGKANSSVIIVTSGSSGEGKSYITANLGAAAALSKQRVLIVEADLRRPSLIREVFGPQTTKAKAGLIDILTGSAKLADVVQSTNLPTLHVLSSGRVGSEAGELLMAGGRLQAVIDEMRANYDLVILDTAPVGLVTDALLLRGAVDATLYIVRYGYTPRSSLEMIEDLSQSGKLPKPAIILNAVKPTRGSTYGTGHGYYQKN